MLPVRHSQNWLPDLFNDFFTNDWAMPAKATAPAMNIMENEKAYTVELAAPGMTKEDFNICLDEDNNLVITMEKKQETPEKDKAGDKKDDVRYWRHEFCYSKFQQAINLPDNVRKDQIGAQMANGVLTVTLPKVTEEEKAKLRQMITIE